MAQKRILRWLVLPAGLFIFLLGLITFPLPVPSGVLLMVLGLAVAAFNPLVLRWIKRTRKKFPHMNKRIQGITPHMPGFLKRPLQRTDSPPRRTHNLPN